MHLLGVALRLMCALLVVTIPVEAAERAPRSISLAQAPEWALAAKPRLTAAERAIGIATGLKVQAGALANPELSFELDNALGSGPYKGLRSAETNLELSQLVELGGKREARLATGDAGIRTAAWQRRATLVGVHLASSHAFLKGVSNHPRHVKLAETSSRLPQTHPVVAKGGPIRA